MAVTVRSEALAGIPDMGVVETKGNGVVHNGVIDAGAGQSHSSLVDEERLPGVGPLLEPFFSYPHPPFEGPRCFIIEVDCEVGTLRLGLEA